MILSTGPILDTTYRNAPFLHLTTKKVDTHTFVSVYFHFTSALNLCLAGVFLMVEDINFYCFDPILTPQADKFEKGQTVAERSSLIVSVAFL